MTHSQKAKEYFDKGYNCAQAVVLAFCDKTGLTEEQAAAMSSSFGGGMGKMGEVCGAVSGMFMVLGLVEGVYAPEDKEAKMAHYQKVRVLADKFKAENGSIICRELLAAHKDKPIVSGHNSHCFNMVMQAADILEEYFASK